MKGKSIIFFFILLMVAMIIVLDLSLKQSKSEAEISVAEEEESDFSKLSENDAFRLSGMALEFEGLLPVKSERNLDDYYANRAYDGAPPTIPHRQISETGIGGKACLQCHGKGGYVQQFEAFAPITPHPEYLNCLQCHVPAKTSNLFASSDFRRSKPKGKGAGVLDGSPPAIPHDLQIRGSCLACHGGPSAPKEIRVSHPERVNCLQCHAPANNRSITWERKSSEGKEDEVE
ncbi:MAG: hypothetical protein ABJG78_10980 [Cyclobacteriaceae bacterium]